MSADILTVHFFSRDAFHVDDPFLTIDLDHLAFASLIRPADDVHLIIFADGQRLDLSATLR